MKKSKDMTNEDMAKSLSEMRAKLRELRFGASGAKSTNVKEARTLRREIARIITERSSRTN
jgi:ribosomal protein L29